MSTLVLESQVKVIYGAYTIDLLPNLDKKRVVYDDDHAYSVANNQPNTTSHMEMAHRYMIIIFQRRWYVYTV